MVKRKKKRNNEFTLEDLARFERFISGKNGDFAYDELASFLTYKRLDELIGEASSEERRTLLIKHYEDSLNDSDRLGWIIVDVYESVYSGEKGRFPDGIYEGYQGRLNFKFMLRYALKVKKKWKNEEIPEKISKKEIRDLKLGRGLDKCFRNCPPEAVMFSYPEMNLRPWYFRTSPENIWLNEDGSVNYAQAVQATKEFAAVWLSKRTEQEIEKILETEKGTAFEGIRIAGKPAALLTRVTIDDFEEPILPHKSNLGRMMAVCYSDAPYFAISKTFPDLPFKPHYFKSAINNYWINKDGTHNLENITAATIEFCTLWLKGRPVSELVHMRYVDFDQGLFPGGSSATGMLQSCLKSKRGFSSYTEVIAAAYPGQLRSVQNSKKKKLIYVGN